VSTGPGSYRGTWIFQNNTDGGILQGMPVPGSWTITVTPTFRQGITTFRWVDDPSTFRSLTLTGAVTIEADNVASSCRTDCTIPVCGDGIWDAGEACDDGNTVSRDGCNATCSAVD
jgi:cysteine-rich repeat protein